MMDVAAEEGEALFTREGRLKAVVGRDGNRDGDGNEEGKGDAKGGISDMDIEVANVLLQARWKQIGAMVSKVRAKLDLYRHTPADGCDGDGDGDGDGDASCPSHEQRMQMVYDHLFEGEGESEGEG